jgi:hypothetical protein
MVIQAALLTAVQEHPVPLVTLTLPVPAALVKFWLDADKA